MNDSIPCKSRVVHDDVDFPIAKLGCLLDQHINVVLVHDVANDSDSTAWQGGIDG